MNDEHPKKDPLADERALVLQITRETSKQTTYAEVVDSQPHVLSTTGEMTKNPAPNISGGITTKSKSDEKQSNDTEQEQHFKASEPPENKPIVIDEGFIGVERKRNKTKQLFLTGIAENVKENQILCYLVDRDVTPTRITIFKSKRKGTISAKVNIPSASLPLVQHEHFWPKFVTCKPWRPNVNCKKADQKVRMTRSGNFSTYV